jgi:hypothetical protein
VKYTVEDAKNTLDDISGCGDHPLPADIVNCTVSEVIAGSRWCNCGEGEAMCHSCCDTGSVVLFLAADGRYVVAREDSDTTGHGCRCSGGAEAFATLGEAVSLGLTQEDRERLRVKP